jgi:hypothetical protein
MDHLKELSEIRNLMERSSRFIDRKHGFFGLRCRTHTGNIHNIGHIFYPQKCQKERHTHVGCRLAKAIDKLGHTPPYPW